MSSGSYFPDWFLQPRRRPERAMVAVVAECYLRGVNTRRVEGWSGRWVLRLSKSPERPRVPCAGLGLSAVPAVTADRDWAELRIRNLKVSLVR